MYKIEHGKFNRPGYTYSGSNNMMQSGYMHPNGAIHMHKGTPDAAFVAKGRALIVRPVNSTSGVKIVSGGGVSGLTEAQVQSLVGTKIGTVDGVPVFLGSPISSSEINGAPVTPLKMDVNTETVSRLQKGNNLMSLPGGNVTMFFPVAVIALIAIIAIVAGAVTISYFITNWLNGSNLAIIEQTKLKRDAMTLAAESTTIEGQWDAGGNHFIKYKDGTLVTIYPDGTYKIDTTAAKDITKLADDVINTPYVTGMDWIPWAIGGIVALIGVYAFVKYGIPAIKKQQQKSEKKVEKSTSAITASPA